MKAVFLSLALLAAIALADPVVKEESFDLSASGDEVDIRSVDYPEDAPALLRQTWKINAPEGYNVRIECYDIRLFEDKPCGDWALTFTAGDLKEEMCTTSFDYKKTFEGNKLEMALRIGDHARGFVGCKAKAVK
uniref:Venom CUB domain protein 2 n=1 Tax=Oncocephalus sp. TaxID=2944721 RepID=A0AB38ZEI7_9HEMI